MSTINSSIKQQLSYRWVKAIDSGRTYLCPADAFSGQRTDAELRLIGVDESENPQND